MLEFVLNIHLQGKKIDDLFPAQYITFLLYASPERWQIMMDSTPEIPYQNGGGRSLCR